jgi:hypothetical protein
METRNTAEARRRDRNTKPLPICTMLSPTPLVENQNSFEYDGEQEMCHTWVIDQIKITFGGGT